jgi:plasmid stability protein
MVADMAVLTIHNVDDAERIRLRLRAAMHRRSLEDEARDILRSALSTEIPGRAIWQALHERFVRSAGSIA